MSTYPAGVKYITGDMPDGVSLGKDSTDLVSLYGVTPVAQASVTTAAVTTASTSTSPYGFTSSQANALLAWQSAVDTALKNIGIIASA